MNSNHQKQIFKIEFTICLLMSFIASFVSCVSEDDMITQKTNNQSVTYRTVEEAVDLAIEAYHSLYNNSRSSTIEVIDTYTSYGRKHRNSTSEPLYYLVNFADSLGFAIVSASSQTVPLLGIAEKGTYSIAEEANNETLSYLLKLTAEYCVQTNNSKPYQRSTISTSNPPAPCAPKVPVLWGQRSPYGNLYSNHIAGCSNVAAAMIMAYFQHPLQMRLSGGENFSLNWSQIRRHIDSSSRCYETDSYDTHIQIAKLLRQIGYENLSISSSSGTGTYLENRLRSLTTNGYACSPFDTFDETDCINYLQHDYLIYMSGAATYANGHDWLMDGFKHLQRSDTPTIYDCYFHHNWGADGRYNGYFLSGIFALQSAYSYDYSCGEADYDFSIDIEYSAVKCTY